MAIVKWNPALNNLDNVLELPKGSLIGDMGFKFEVSFTVTEVMTVAEELQAKSVNQTVYSQAGVMILGQKQGLECTANYVPLSGG